MRVGQRLGGHAPLTEQLRDPPARARSPRVDEDGAEQVDIEQPAAGERDRPDIVRLASHRCAP
jgi:hypothetical protein